MIAAKKLMMAGRAPKPFSLSGSFETGLDGWVAKGMTRLTAAQGGGAARTGQYAMNARRNSFADDAIEYYLSKQNVRGLSISFRINGNSNNGGPGGRARLQVSYDSGASFSLLNEWNLANGPGWVGHAHGWVPPKDRDIILRYSAEAPQGSFDDWEIRGIRA